MTDSDYYLTRSEIKALSTKLKDTSGWIADELDNVITRQTARADNGKRPASAERPLVYSEDAARIAEKLNTELLHWIDHISRYRNREWIGRVATTKSAAQWLDKHLIDLACTPEAPNAYEAILTAITASIRAVDIRRPARLAGPCQSDLPGITCDGIYVTRDATDDYECRGCGITCNIPEMVEQTRQAVAERHYPARDLASAMSIVTETEIRYERIRNWVRRGKLEQVGTNWSGEPLYRLNDAIQLLNRTKGRAA